MATYKYEILKNEKNDERAKGIAKKVARFGGGLTALGIIGTAATAIAGGALLAATGGAAGLVALGVAGAVANTGAIYTGTRLFQQKNAYADAMLNLNKAYKPNIKPKWLMNPGVQLAISAVTLSAGIALTVATGGILPLALGAAMIAAGGLGVVGGGVALAAKGVKSLFSRKKNKASKKAPAVTTVNQPIPPALKAAAPAGSNVSAKQDFTAAVKDVAPAQTAPAPAAKPAAAPKPPKAA